MPEHEDASRAEAIRRAHSLGLDRPFEARRAKTTGRILAVVSVLAGVLLAVVVTAREGVSVSVGDRIGFVSLGVALAWFSLRQAGVRATPEPDGLLVRNLFLSRRVTWDQIVSVRFGQGRPWAQLDLDGADTLAVMAIQSADGVRAKREASRLASLVELHQGRRGPDLHGRD